jgi:predicted nuclease of predicted toxin-antitoxin system
VRFLADESCDFNVVRTLREAGFDVLAVVEVIPRAADDQVIGLAVIEDRILLTEDKDFGQLVYASAEALSDYLVRTGGVEPSETAVDEVLLGSPFDDAAPDPRLSVDVDHYLYGASRRPRRRR